MKYRESGMPDEQMWDNFFDPAKILSQLEVNSNANDFLDIGCGYGTFLFPAATLIKGTAIGVDVDRAMITNCVEKAEKEQKRNIRLIEGDVSDLNTQQKIKDITNTIDYISLFNILHCERPVELLKVITGILTDGGKVGVIHWNYNDTPRGPSMQIRPKPDDIIEWAKIAGLKEIKHVDLPPYHYGLVFSK
jgi:SAM-dependent methyltransferase